MYCRMCGAQIPSGSKFCPACGAQQDAVVPPQAPPQAYQETPPQTYQETPPQTYQQAPAQTPPQAPPQAYPPAQANQSAQAAPKKKNPLIPALAVVLVIVVAAAAFFAIKAQNEKKEKEQKQDSMASYIDGELVELEKVKDQVVDSFEYAAYESGLELENTLKLSAQLVGAATDVSTSLAKSDPELGMVSSTYVGFATKCLSATKKLKAAYDADDVSSQANDIAALMEEADDLYSQFQQELKALADERDARYTGNSKPPFEDLLAAIRADL